MKFARLAVQGSAAVCVFGGVLTSVATAAPIFDSHGFEATSGYATGAGLQTQPLLPTAQQWDDFDPSQGAQTVLTYTAPTVGNAQYVRLQQTNAENGQLDLTYPKNLPFSTMATDSVATVTWTMTNTTAPTATGNVLLGITTIDGASNDTAIVGINSSDGSVYGLTEGATPGSLPSFSAALNVAYAYQLVLNYGASAKTYSLYEKQIGVDPNFILVGKSTFLDSGSNQFYTAALTSESLANGSSATAVIDDFTIAIPEPASLGIMGISAVTLLARRRRR